MTAIEPTRLEHGRFATANVDDGDRYETIFFEADDQRCPVRNWLAGFLGDGTGEAALAGLEDGSLEPMLAEGVVLAALAGCGIEPTPSGSRTWGHLDAILSTPHPQVHVAVCFADGPGERFRLGLERPPSGVELPSPAEVAAAVRATTDALRAGLSEMPEPLSVPPLRPFRASEGGRSFAQLAARKGIAVDPEAALAVDLLQDAANVEAKAIRSALREGAIDAEAAWERGDIGRRAWLVEATRLVGSATLVAVLDDEAVPDEPPPEVPGWPYWLRSMVAHGPEYDRDNKGDLYKLMQAIGYLCGNGGYDAIDAAYRRLDVSAVGEVAMIALLRTPFTSRGRLNDWTDFRERVRAELLKRDKPADKILAGLGKPGEPDA